MMTSSFQFSWAEWLMTPLTKLVNAVGRSGLKRKGEMMSFTLAYCI